MLILIIILIFNKFQVIMSCRDGICNYCIAKRKQRISKFQLNETKLELVQ